MVTLAPLVWKFVYRMAFAPRRLHNREACGATCTGSDPDLTRNLRRFMLAPGWGSPLLTLPIPHRGPVRPPAAVAYWIARTIDGHH